MKKWVILKRFFHWISLLFEQNTVFIIAQKFFFQYCFLLTDVLGDDKQND